MIRIAVGLIMAGHGAQMLLGWWGGQGIGKGSGAVASMCSAKPHVFALLVASGAERAARRMA